MRSIIVRTVLAIGLVLVAVSGVAWAQDEGITLESLAEAIAQITGRVDSHDDRIAAIETAIAPTPTATLEPTLENRANLTIGRRMNVRRGPGTNYEIIGIAETGDTFEITGKNLSQDWWQIEYKGDAAWVYAPYVTTFYDGNVEVVPTPTVEPTVTPRPTIAPPSTATPRPAATTRPVSEDREVTAEVAAAALAVSDWLHYQQAWQALPEETKDEITLAYQVLLAFAAGHCELSYEEVPNLINVYAVEIEEAGVIFQGLEKPRLFLLGFLWGFAGGEGSDSSIFSCGHILDLGVAAALSGP
ncbi:MAG: SH3 domain-containing protein [Caldilineaceae bacterium]|nr:SH3 domain-containing protein [Caldilineaceae bacterium]